MDWMVSRLVEAAWEELGEDHPARLAIASIQEPDVREAVANNNLRPRELATYAADNLRSDEITSLMRGAPIVETSEDVKTLASATRIDRRVRRIVFGDQGVYANMSPEEQLSTAWELDPGDGRDDFVIAVLPRWVGAELDFDAASLAPTLGALAGAQLLAATGPDTLSDSEVWNLITNPPQGWEHYDEERKWHQRSHVRDALYMVFTHRPDLARAAAEDPDMVQYVMRSPHWEADFAHNIRGVDLESGTLTEEACRNTPGTLLSLVWNPKTPLEQAQKIFEIAEEGMASTPYMDDWKVTASASETRIDIQPGHVVEYSTVSDLSLLQRLTRRIYKGLSATEDLERLLNGYLVAYSIRWQKRYEEGLALLTNPFMRNSESVEWPFIESVLRTKAPHTTPKGTWSRNQLVAAGFNTDMHMPAPDTSRGIAKPTHMSLPVTEKSVYARVAEAVDKFETLPAGDQSMAWGLLLSLAADADGPLGEDLVEATMSAIA